ncbi:MAG: hypothetical protein LBR39_04490 [Coriobacteriales bacterium]|jgi:ABC-type cobalamin/Fe3+-siderophores transport system ATPase subunit|nr:hypothetical protein [Coriobacteriales bacterium]
MPAIPIALPPYLNVLIGHYGSGKTTLALNLARDLKDAAEKVTLVDLDIVNPYFRSSDSEALLISWGVTLLGPVYGRNAPSLDTPSLTPGIDEAILAAGEGAGQGAGQGHAVVVDVGGDPDGARALGRYSANIRSRPHRLLYVANFRRPEAAAVADNLQLVREIEATSGLQVTAVVGNTHLKQLTTAQTVLEAVSASRELADALGVPLLAVTAPRAEAAAIAAIAQDSDTASSPAIYPLDALVTTPWE